MDTPRNLVIQPVEFWFIWTKTGRIPRRTHSTELAADKEAFRLAHKHPGKKFIVLKAQYKVHSQDPADDHFKGAV